MLSSQSIDADRSSGAAPAVDESAAVSVPSFEDIYSKYFDFVWRSTRRLGVPEEAAEDIAQEVFVVVHRKLDSFEGRASIKGWIFGVIRGVVSNYRRGARRAKLRLSRTFDQGDAPDPNSERQPHAKAEQAEAVRTLYRILDELDDDKRAVFVLAELEQLAVVEISTALGMNINTTYSRLRAARGQFKAAVARYQASDGWRAR